MTHKRMKFSVAGVVLVGAVAYLGFAGMKQGWVYTMPVDQYVAAVEKGEAAGSQRVRLCGTVSEQDMEISKGQLFAKFTLKGESASGGGVRVHYKGVIPDMFKAGSEVVAEGKRNGEGVFVSDVIMTKCASKYEERPAGHPQVEAQNAKLQTQNVEKPEARSQKPEEKRMP